MAGASSSSKEPEERKEVTITQRLVKGDCPEDHWGEQLAAALLLDKSKDILEVIRASARQQRAQAEWLQALEDRLATFGEALVKLIAAQHGAATKLTPPCDHWEHNDGA